MTSDAGRLEGDRLTFGTLWDWCDDQRQFWQACADNAEALGGREEVVALHRRKVRQQQKLCDLLTLIGSDPVIKARLYELTGQ
jgi:hypothetical protein